MYKDSRTLRKTWGLASDPEPDKGVRRQLSLLSTDPRNQTGLAAVEKSGQLSQVARGEIVIRKTARCVSLIFTSREGRRESNCRTACAGLKGVRT